MKHNDIIEKVNQLSYSDLSEGSFRLFTTDNESIFYGIDHEKNMVFAIQSLNPRVAPILQKTKKLRFAFNTRCKAHFESAAEEKFMHILTCYSKEEEDISAFIRLTDSFVQSYNENKYPISSLFTSLSSLFANDHRIINLNQARGFYGELYAIKYFQENSLTIYPYWQKRERLNFDFSITSRKRLEVKSTISTNRIHHFLHEQLVSDIYDVYVISILLRNDDQGLSLKSLIKEVREIARDDFDTLLYIDKLARGIHEEDASLIKFDEEYTRNNIRFYNAKIIPKFESEQPEGVSQTEYNSDLTNIPPTLFEIVKGWIQNE